MKAAWYNVLTLKEKNHLCLLLESHGIAYVHPGSLLFVDQRKLANFVISTKDKGVLYKLYSTCGECGRELPAHRKQVSSAWLCSICLDCSRKAWPKPETTGHST